MSPNFLHAVSASEIHEKMTSLLDLWALKVQDGNGKPLNKDLDVAFADIIMAVAFDVPMATILWPGESYISILAL